MAATPITLRAIRAQGHARLARGLAGLAVLFSVVAAWLLPAVVEAQSLAVRGEASIATKGGYGRLIIRLAEEVDVDVRVNGAIMIISFKQPVDVNVDKLSTIAPDYISAARRDPDGGAIRIALARRVTVNTMPAAERLFIDLLPDSWSGLPPSLPAEVVDELARRAREAERALKAARARPAQKKQQNLRVKVGIQPTFTRYMFELPDRVSVTTDRTGDRFTLTFDQPINYDLADVRATLPPALEAVNTELESDSAAVSFVFNGEVDVRSFREDKFIVVDVGGKANRAEAPAEAAGTPPGKLGLEPPETVPAKAEGAKNEAPPPEKKDRKKSAVEPAKPEPAKAEVARAEAPKLERAKSEAKSEVRSEAKSEPAKADTAKAEAVKSEPAKPEPVKPDVAKSEPAPKPAAAAAPALKVAAAESPASAPVAPAPTPAVRPAPAALAASMAVAPLDLSAPATIEPSAAARASPLAAEGPKPAVAAAPAPPPAPAAAPASQRGEAPIVVSVSSASEGMRLVFPFRTPTPAAVFRRADTLWLVFDTDATIDLAAVSGETAAFRSAAVVHPRDGETVVRLKLERPRLASFVGEGRGWAVILGDTMVDPTRPLGISRNIIGVSKSNITIPFDDARQLHRLTDPDTGEALLAVTALGPARGFVKGQEFIELRALPSTHGVALQPLADDVQVELAVDKIVISRPLGLTLSQAAPGKAQGGYRPQVFDPQLWGFERQTEFNERQSELIRNAAAAPESKRRNARIDLARFYIARDMYAEAKGVLDVALAGDGPSTEDTTGIVLKSVANLMLDRTDEALKDLSNPAVGNQHDAPLWRALAFVHLGKWAEARDAFKIAEPALGTLPAELQRMALMEFLRTSIEVKDFGGAAQQINDLETLGVQPEMEPKLAVLTGRVAEGLGRNDDALAAYRAAADSRARPVSAQGRLREVQLRLVTGEMQRPDAITELENLTTSWRGDETEVEALQVLAHLYTEENRYRDAFHVMRTALLAHPNSDMTRRIFDEAAVTFDSLFLAGKGDSMPPIEALGLFYDFRELTPIGRRGDEMIRRLADRLVSVDLLDQAAELLQHQVDHRLQGAARSQVATRLALIYLANRKPDRAMAALRSTRSGDLATDLRNQRVLIEARAISDSGRHELALEVIAGIRTPEANKLRADVMWAAKRWRDAAEQIELFYGERWKDFAPLTDFERPDILRAAIGYALGEDSLGLDRFREKYAAKMAETPDRRAFEVVTSPLGTDRPEFREIATAISSIDTLKGFLRELRSRYPDSGALGPPGSGAALETKPAADAPVVPPRKGSASRGQADKTPTGSIPRKDTPRAAAKAN